MPLGGPQLEASRRRPRPPSLRSVFPLGALAARLDDWSIARGRVARMLEAGLVRGDPLRRGRLLLEDPVLGLVLLEDLVDVL